MRGKKGVPRPALSEDVTLTFPRLEKGDIAQDEEWFEARLNGGIRRIRFHDYGRIYEVPGLYEKLFYEELKCASPETIRSLLDEGAIQTRAQRRYRHRFNSQGRPLYYIAMVASKVHAESASALMVR